MRTKRWHLVTVAKPPTTPLWQLFDVVADPGEQQDVAATNPEVVQRLSGEFESWWTSVRPQMVNEGVTGPSENPFAVAWRAQTGAAK